MAGSDWAPRGAVGAVVQEAIRRWDTAEHTEYDTIIAWATERIRAVTTPAAIAPPMRLREYYSGTTRAWYRVRDGVVETRCAESDSWSAPAAVNTADIVGVYDLMLRPEGPAPDVVVEAIKDWYDVHEGCTSDKICSSAASLATTIRAIVREEVAGEQPAWSEEALEETVRFALRAWHDTAHKSGADCAEYVTNEVRAASFSQQPTLTVAQHVEALVGMGAKEEEVRINATVGRTHMGAGTRVLILPTGGAA
jgi:hypothetical protein